MTRAILLLVLLTSCEDRAAEAALVTGGDPHRGEARIGEKGCGSCHTIPGVRGAIALVGPPLEHMASRSYVAGMLPNTPANLQRWIQHPQQVKPNNAMPELGVSDEEARDISAYLYTLR